MPGDLDPVRGGRHAKRAATGNAFRGGVRVPKWKAGGVKVPRLDPRKRREEEDANAVRGPRNGTPSEPKGEVNAAVDNAPGHLERFRPDRSGPFREYQKQHDITFSDDAAEALARALGCVIDMPCITEERPQLIRYLLGVKPNITINPTEMLRVFEITKKNICLALYENDILVDFGPFDDRSTLVALNLANGKMTTKTDFDAVNWELFLTDEIQSNENGFFVPGYTYSRLIRSFNQRNCSCAELAERDSFMLSASEMDHICSRHRSCIRASFINFFRRFNPKPKTSPIVVSKVEERVVPDNWEEEIENEVSVCDRLFSCSNVQLCITEAPRLWFPTPTVKTTVYFVGGEEHEMYHSTEKQITNNWDCIMSIYSMCDMRHRIDIARDNKETGLNYRTKDGLISVVKTGKSLNIEGRNKLFSSSPMDVGFIRIFIDTLNPHCIGMIIGDMGVLKNSCSLVASMQLKKDLLGEIRHKKKRLKNIKFKGFEKIYYDPRVIGTCDTRLVDKLIEDDHKKDLLFRGLRTFVDKKWTGIRAVLSTDAGAAHRASKIDEYTDFDTSDRRRGNRYRKGMLYNTVSYVRSVESNEFEKYESIENKNKNKKQSEELIKNVYDNRRVVEKQITATVDPDYAEVQFDSWVSDENLMLQSTRVRDGKRYKNFHEFKLMAGRGAVRKQMRCIVSLELFKQLNASRYCDVSPNRSEDVQRETYKRASRGLIANILDDKNLSLEKHSYIADNTIELCMAAWKQAVLTMHGGLSKNF